MARKDAYGDQVELLLRCLPVISQAQDFALKGGTAINLFLQDMPRLSVDIDLTYLPITGREAALIDIQSQLNRVATELERSIPGANVRCSEGAAPKLFVERSGARIKVEPSTVVRGSLVPPVSSELSRKAQDAYELFVEVRRLDAADLYAGKLCAALDRQHPRDLFDVMHLQAAGPIPETVRQAFVAYIAGHGRPIAELLAPNVQPIEDLFSSHFSGMTEEPIELVDLQAARTRLLEWVATALTESERRFLLSIKLGSPEWTLLPFEGLERWPAIQWKLHNIGRMSPRRHKEAVARLRELLQL